MPMSYALHAASGLEELSQDLRLRVHHAAYVEEHEPGARFRNRLPHARVFAVLACQGADGGSCQVGTQREVLLPGCVVLVPPSVELSLHFAPGLRLVAVHMDCRLSAGFDLLAETKLQSLAWGQARVRSWRTCLFEKTDALSAAMTMQGELLLLLARSRLITGERLRTLRAAHGRYQPIMQLLRERPPASVNLPDCALAMHMGVSTLSRAFHRDCGLTLRAFLQDRILHSALDQLRSGHLSSRAISEHIGFATEQAFSRFIRRHTGLSPGRYRQRMREISWL